MWFFLRFSKRPLDQFLAIFKDLKDQFFIFFLTTKKPKNRKFSKEFISAEQEGIKIGLLKNFQQGPKGL